MKKWILTIFLTLFLVTTPKASASCQTVVRGLGCQKVIQCDLYGAPGFCCDTQAECGQKGQQITDGQKATQAEIERQKAQEGQPLCGVDKKGVNTAFGCLMAGDPPKMISQLLGWGAIVGAGIAFLMIVFAGIQITLAGGDPKKIQATRELITSAVAGLFLIIFSVLLLNFIGVKILGLNTLGFSL